MTAAIALFVMAVQGPSGPGPGADHPSNPVYQDLSANGFAVGPAKVTFPPPRLRGREPAGAERAALAEVAGSERAVSDFTRDSVTAPFVLKVRDEPADDLGVIRMTSLWFVIRATLDDIDPAGLFVDAGKGKAVEAGNMRFSEARLGARELGPLGIKPAEREWFVHLSGRLLDRLRVYSTDRVTATRSETSWLVASKTDRRFDDSGAYPNRWNALSKDGPREEPGPPHPYPGGAGYVAMTRLGTVPGALLVEAHAAFFEPKGWFDGRPILRSKIGVVAQDRIRSLRRELARSKARGGGRGGG
jgi:hypothetical protein